MTLGEETTELSTAVESGLAKASLERGGFDLKDHLLGEREASGVVSPTESKVTGEEREPELGGGAEGVPPTIFRSMIEEEGKAKKVWVLVQSKDPERRNPNPVSVL